MSKKHHHYISNFLCKHFSSDKICFFRYNHEEQKIISVSTKDGFVQKHLYRLKKKDGTFSDKMEDFFSDHYEAPASTAIKNLIIRLGKTDNSKQLIPPKEFIQILQFCILSHLRTPHKLNEIYLSQVRALLMVTYVQFELKGVPLDSDFSVNLNKDFIFMEVIKSIQAIVRSLKDLSIHIYFHRCPDRYLVLPDQPVALYSSANQEFGSPALKIYFPITSNIMISFERGVQFDILTEINGNAIDEMNQLACGRFYRYIACENKVYLEKLVAQAKLNPEPIQSEESLEQDKQKIKQEVKHHIQNRNGSSTILVNDRHGVHLIADKKNTPSKLKSFWKSLLKKIFQ
jgi:hypothetical protein